MKGRIVTITLEDIQQAAKHIRGGIDTTPLVHSRTLSRMTGAEVYLKFENLQFTASFKERGALNKLLSLSKQERANGVIAMSAGNHAQAVAYHAQQLGIPTTIVMPRYTPNIKVEHTRAYGANVILHGETFDDAAGFTLQKVHDEGLTLIHPYDDAKVIAGQGTIALEMLKVQPELDVLLIPIGGGGLIAGNATAAKAIKPDIQVIGVEASRYPSVYATLHQQPPQYGTSTIAEGIAVKKPGEITLAIIEKLVDDVVLVDEAQIEQAVLLLLEVEKTVAEGAGAVGLAALLQEKEKYQGRRVGLIISGGNIDMPVLESIIQRGMVRDGRMIRLRIELRDVPGSLASATKCLEDAGANIVHVHHHRTFTEQPLQSVDVEFVLQTRGKDHTAEIAEALKGNHFKVLSDL
jgi:threonine dehydratase